MLVYVNFPGWIHPEVVSFLPIRWYAVMYLVAFGITYLLARCQVRKREFDFSGDDLVDLFFYCILGLLIGARLFSCLFYTGSSYYWTHPHKIFWPFENGHFVGLPGMSYHGGVVGCVIGGIIFAKVKRKNFFECADLLCAGIPLGYTFGRIGNFINGELWGRVSTKPWAMVFPDAPSYSTNLSWVRDVADSIGMEYTLGEMINLPRHPSQLYEAFFEGIVLFLIMWFIIRPLRKKTFNGIVLSSYLIGYGAIRFVLEYFREPDRQLGYIIRWGKGSSDIELFSSFLNISMGQIFCFIMILAGIILMFISRKINYRSLSNDSRRKDKSVKTDHQKRRS